MRKAWGCDAPSEAPVYTRTCMACQGASEACGECGGRGQVTRYRCPASESDQMGAIVVRTLANTQNGILPAAGGWANQSAKLMRLVDLASGEKGRIEEAQRSAKPPATKGAQGGRKGSRARRSP